MATENNSIGLKSVDELSGMKFFIPSYQRGYRWTPQQVLDLLDDVNKFEPKELPVSKEKSWYCLQPLVVKEMDEKDIRLDSESENKDWYEVIDGQQRLTTIFIILKILGNGETPFSLSYQTRSESGTFLSEIKNKDKDSSNINIDFHFMWSAKNTVEKWRDGDDKPHDSEKFVEKLKNYCKVIWYETSEDAYEVFKRLNSGKISLSNAELVKALLLKDENFRGLNTDALRLTQLEMAGEWDRMEQTLHDNSFWYFINPEPEDARFNCTRIDFLLEMVLRCEKNEKNEFSYVIEDELKRNDYFIFSTYSEIINSDGWLKQWRKIQKYFRIMKSWYDNRQLYHYVGYLMNLKGGNKMEMLCDLLCEAEKTKSGFLEFLKGSCRSSLIKDANEVLFSDWEYGKNNNEIHNVLLLFNLATTQNQISEMSRYPFDKHYEAAKKKWSLEHIHAQNEKKAVWNKDQFKSIKGYLEKISVKGIDVLKESLNKNKKETSDDIDDATYSAIVGAFMGKPVEIKTDDAGETIFESSFEKDDHLTNMALLQGDKNAAFNNKLYPEKREKLAEYENVENESLFVPICTRNVFFKHYSPKSSNPLLWDKQAGEDYVTAIVKVVANFLDLDAILPKDIENGDLCYGVKLKENSK